MERKRRYKESARKILEMNIGDREDNSGIYLVREKIQREMIRSRAGRRAWDMKRRLKEGKGSELAREEMRSKGKEGRVMSG